MEEVSLSYEAVSKSWDWDFAYSRVGEDESQKVCTLLSRYVERGVTRKKLADALEKLKMSPLAQDVLSGYFISDQ